MKILDGFNRFLLPQYENFPRGRYVSILLLRTTESEVIFRTEGGNLGLAKEFVSLENKGVVQRVVITKRKQVAVERRTGRELLREFDKLYYTGKKRPEDVCALNRNNPCEICIDCRLYGFAVGGGGAQKSRVLTQDSYSLLPAAEITDKRTFNALYDNSTMRDPLDKTKASSSLGEVEYVRPGSHFIDFQVLKDVTEEEFIYVLGNILRSKRYGAISSRIGRVKNQILGIYFSHCELISNLELTQAVAAELKEEWEYPLPVESIKDLVIKKAEDLCLHNTYGTVVSMDNVELMELLEEVKKIFSNRELLEDLINKTEAKYGD